ncbi:transposase (plasmid) [Ralstonia pseudosolanacearum]|uniref:Transposase n=1 Tax=Ralstonia solanacearum TaxID=305 RepID=A0AA92IGD4_RALSL|nr:transposase [Ralstonia pseudosolanacearum]
MTELHRKAIKLAAARFLRNLITAVLYRIHTVLTDNGIQFTNRTEDRDDFGHIFGRTCTENDIEHRLAKVRYPWTNGRVEIMNRTIEEATVRRYRLRPIVSLKITFATSFRHTTLLAA